MMTMMERQKEGYEEGSIWGGPLLYDQYRSLKKMNAIMGGMKQGVLQGQVNWSLLIYSFRVDIII